MKKLLSIVVMVLLGVSSVWAEQISVDLYNPSIQPVPTSHELITQTPGSTNTKAVNSWWDNNITSISPFNQSQTWGEITFTAIPGTVLGTYYFEIAPHFTGGVFGIGAKYPYYKVNNGDQVTINANPMPHEQNDNYNKSQLSIQGRPTRSWYYPRFRNFKFTVVIPEVVDRTTTSITVLDKIAEADLQNGDNTSKGMIPFVVKDPIDTDNPQYYFAASIPSKTGETWSIDDSGWQCIENNETNRNKYNVDDATANSKILLVPVTYTATNGTTGTFEASIQLTSLNTYNDKDDIQKAQITVAEKEVYPISWGNSWEDGSEINLFKGKTYPRTGAGGYLANTDGFESILSIPEVENINPTTPASPIVSFDAQGTMTLHQEGKVKLTYTQPATDEYKEKVLTLTINVIKQTPEFTLHYDEKVGDTYVFYVNRDYKPFLTSSNTTADDIITISHADDANNQFISFDATNATTYAVPMDNIQITIVQEDGDFWYEGSATYTIAIREDPIHVGTLCDRKPAELLLDSRCYVGGSLVGYEGDDIVLGSTGGNTNGGWAVFKFMGAPDKLQ